MSTSLTRPSDGVLCIIPGPRHEVRREPAGDPWCFGCRARLAHDWVLLDDDPPGYYEPLWVRECSRCGHDRTHFPG